ncbi:hypothetical protein CPB84DRAFT_1853139 [Gymnopilus junonius]|uniref:Uncharacterized protein n=1 Tax=Gymnopilus junonius TaxID=109634 RepID=A0A9P5N9R0_GYMJU|nr:hypothetical protein CPB84DRAFT_1853139 [Gymnopilus junonius]
MVDHLRSDAAQMAGLCIEAVLYGIYLVTLSFVLVYIFRSESGSWRRPTGIRIGTLAVALILAINSTLNLAWGLTRIMQTYIFKIGAKGPTWIDLAKPYTVIIQTLTADLFLTYRCWAVYGKSLRVALCPSALAWRASGSRQLKLTRFFTAQFALTTTLNVYATSAIVYRIWKTDRSPDFVSSVDPNSNNRQRRTKFQRINQIIVQSALIYTSASIMAFASYKSNAQYITSAVDIIAVGLAFNLIVIRLALERTEGRREVGSEGRLTTLKFTSNSRDPRRSNDCHIESTNSLQPSPSTLLEKNSSHSQREKVSA